MQTLSVHLGYKSGTEWVLNAWLLLNLPETVCVMISAFQSPGEIVQMVLEKD